MLVAITITFILVLYYAYCLRRSISTLTIASNTVNSVSFLSTH